MVNYYCYIGTFSAFLIILGASIPFVYTSHQLLTQQTDNATYFIGSLFVLNISLLILTLGGIYHYNYCQKKVSSEQL